MHALAISSEIFRLKLLYKLTLEFPSLNFKTTVLLNIIKYAST